jgi:hypothetical protein
MNVNSIETDFRKLKINKIKEEKIPMLSHTNYKG